ncbi:MAG: cell division protein ZipA C-terminal FtsZ-binding domain-containing protein [Gammaproteobacteria bacterium]
MHDILRIFLITLTGLITLAAVFDAIWRALRSRRLARTCANTSPPKTEPNFDATATMDSFVEDADMPVVSDTLSQIDEDAPIQVTLPEEQDLADEPKVEQFDQTATETNTAIKRPILILSIHAQSGQTFGGYEFLQHLGSVGLSFGEKDIFHYYAKTDSGDETLFSLAQLTKPGTFDIDNIEDVACPGVLLFLDCAQVSDRVFACEQLCDTAKELSKRLNGRLFVGYDQPWTTDARQTLLDQAHGK